MSGRSYVNNSMNRSLGRVGMPIGSCVHSSSSSGRSGGGNSASGYSPSSAYSTSSSTQRCYADNASNRSIGRVGKQVGSHVLHKDGSTSVSTSASSSSTKMYVDNHQNRKLDRVGEPVGSHILHKDGSMSVSSLEPLNTSKGVYVDNTGNRKLNRVGKQIGTHVAHTDGSVTITTNGGLSIEKYTAENITSGSRNMSGRSYVNNSMYRSLGRVGMPLGSCVQSSSSSGRSGGGSSASGYFSSSSASSTSSSTQRCYVDNASNRNIGQVGMQVGSHVVHKDSYVSGSTTVSGASSSSTKMYVDNHQNRRVEKPVETHIQHKDGSMSVSSLEPLNTSKGVYMDNAVNRKLDRLGKRTVGRSGGGSSASGYSSAYSTSSSTQRCYVDNPSNRSIGQVGMQVGSHVVHKDSSVSGSTTVSGASSSSTKMYVDNHQNRRVGKPVGTHIQHKDGSMSVSSLEPLNTSKGESGINPSTNYTKANEMMKEIIPLSDISIEEKIGEGGFGKVYAALWKGNPVAFKKLAYQQISKKKKDQLVKEIQIFSKLSHDNIVKMFGVVVDVENIGIVMEYLPKTLYHAIFIEEVQFSCEKKKKIIGEIISALSYLHTPQDTPLCSRQEIAHCDVKSQNILLDVNNVAKLCDFGLSAIKNTVQSSSTSSLAAPGQGTPRYAAPEVLRGEVLTMSGLMMTDVYSLSLVVYEILVEEEPYENFNRFQLVENVGRGSTRPSLEGTYLTTAVKELLAKGWDRTPSRRPVVARFSSDFSGIGELIQCK